MKIKEERHMTVSAMATARIQTLNGSHCQCLACSAYAVVHQVQSSHREQQAKVIVHRQRPQSLSTTQKVTQGELIIFWQMKQ